MALFDHEYRDIITMIRTVGKPEFEIFATPDEFQADHRWHVQYPNDSHPSKWASNLIAIDILARLGSSGFLPKVTLDPEHQAIAEKGIEASRSVDPADLQKLLRGAGTPYPRAYERTSEPPKISTSGITNDWKACPQGRLVLEPDGDGVEISFDEVRPMPNQLTCEARSTKNHGSWVGIVEDGKATCSVLMPDDGLPVEMVWHFSRFTCTGSQDCFAARFRSLRGVQRKRANSDPTPSGPRKSALDTPL